MKNRLHGKRTAWKWTGWEKFAENTQFHVDERHAFPDEKQTRTHCSKLRTKSSERNVISRAPFHVNVIISGTKPQLLEKPTRTGQPGIEFPRKRVVEILEVLESEGDNCNQKSREIKGDFHRRRVGAEGTFSPSLKRFLNDQISVVLDP